MKIIKKLSLISIILLSSILFANGQSEVEDFDIKNATNSVENLKGSIEKITEELFRLDEKQRNEEGISEQYKETRNEIVNVINSINQTTEKVNTILKQISIYKDDIKKASEEIKNSRIGSQNTKENIKEFLNIIYKLDNKLYNEDGSKIDTIKLLINSDNIPRTLANDYAVESIILQLNNLINNFNEEEQYQLTNIQKLNSLKKEAQNKLKEYQVDIEKLQQKKILSNSIFMTLQKQ